jgi:hypothetical protein
VEVSDEAVPLFRYADDGGMAGGRRSTFLFEAATGELLGALPASAEELWGLPTLAAGGIAPATPPAATAGTTPTPHPTATPLDAGGTSKPLAAGQVPTAVVDTARELPLVEGAWWRYRSTYTYNGLFWERIERTIAVAESVLVATDTVRSTLAFDPPNGLGFLHEGTPHWYLMPGAVLGGSTAGLDRLDALRAVPTAVALERRTGRPGHAPRPDMYPFPLESGEHLPHGWRVIARHTLDTPAGTFPSCALLHADLAMRVQAGIWLCPGVGFTRAEIPVLGSAHGDNGLALHELIAYHIPPLSPAP